MVPAEYGRSGRSNFQRCGKEKPEDEEAGEGEEEGEAPLQVQAHHLQGQKRENFLFERKPG